jgi:hypothetical protein
VHDVGAVAGTSDADALRAIVRRLQVHYDVEPELDLRGRSRVRVGVTLRLWGVHAKGTRALPGCAKCGELAARLREIAEFVASEAEEGTRVAIEPPARGLYASRVVPDADEIALPIRVAPERWGVPLDGREERCLKRMRARLRQLGAAER